MMTWFMVVEDDFGQERYFSDDPMRQLDSGNFTKVPMLLGRTAVEFVDPVEGKIEPCSSTNVYKNEKISSTREI